MLHLEKDTYHFSSSPVGQKETPRLSQLEEVEKWSAPMCSGRREKLDVGNSRSPLYGVFFIQDHKKNMNKSMF